MALLILAHPHYSQSIANKTIVNALVQAYPDLELRDIFKLYSDYQIDIAAEQEALLKHDTIILQYPMFWFNMPAILKLWFDVVFTYQFAYGTLGNKLKNKKVIISMTVGQTEEKIANKESNLIKNFVKSAQYSLEYAQMDLIGTYFLYDVSPISGHTQSEIESMAMTYSQNLLNKIINP